MKKLLALLLSTVLTLSCFGMAVFAEDETPTEEPTTEASSLVFDLGFDDYSETNQQFKNKAGNTAIATKKKGGVAPVKTAYETVDGQTVSYMNFYKPTGKWSSGEGSAAEAYIGDEILGQNELTFEFWVRSTKPAESSWGRIFNIGGEISNKEDDKPILDVELNNAVTSFRLGNGIDLQYTVEGTDHTNLWNGEWKHIVMSRKWEATNEAGGIAAPETGTLTTEIYINGEKISGTPTLSNCQSPKAQGEADMWANDPGVYQRALAIGAQRDASGAFTGDIASFKVYNKNLTENEIKADYEKGKALYEATPLVVIDMDLSNYDGTQASLADKGIWGGTSFVQTEHVAKGTYTNMNGKTVNYLDKQQTTVDGTNYRGRAEIINSSFTTLENQTINVWARIPHHEGRDAGQLVAQVERMHYDSARFEAELVSGTNGFKVFAMGNNTKNANITPSTASFEPYQNVWANYTFTKSWSKDSDGNDVLTWRTFINGKLISEGSGEGAMSKDASSYDRFCLGSKDISETGYGGADVDFSAFTIYAKAFTAEEVAAKYADTYKDYTELKTIDVNFDNFDGSDVSTLSNRDASTAATFSTKGSNGLDMSVSDMASHKGMRKVLAAGTGSETAKADNLYVTAEGLADQTELSVEMWVNWKEGAGRLVAIGNGQEGADGGSYFDVYANPDRPYFDYSAVGNDKKTIVNWNENKNFAPTDGWTHLVFNRKVTWDGGNETANVSWAAYKNGELLKDGSGSGAVAKETNFMVNILADGATGRGVTADLGTFKVRNKALSKAEVAEIYAAEADSYRAAQVGVGVSALTTDETTAAATVSVKNVSEEAMPCAVLLAAYDAETGALAGMALAKPEGEGNIAVGETFSPKLTVSGLSAGKTYTYKAFTWKGLSAMSPLVDVMTLTK